MREPLAEDNEEQWEIVGHRRMPRFVLSLEGFLCRIVTLQLKHWFRFRRDRGRQLAL